MSPPTPRSDSTPPLLRRRRRQTPTMTTTTGGSAPLLLLLFFLPLAFSAASAIPFASSSSSSAPDPSSLLLAPSLRRSPLPSNAPWLNFALNRGDAPEYIHPYLIRSHDGAISIGYPSKVVSQNAVIQSFVHDLTIASSASHHVVTAYDDLSVTLGFGDHLTVPLVRGSPYVTFVFSDSSATFRISSVHSVSSVSADAGGRKNKVTLHNGQTWLLYSSSPLFLSSDLTVMRPFSGTLRVALLPSASAEWTLDRFQTIYPVGGSADLSEPFKVTYTWQTSGKDDSTGQLLMLSLPTHRDLMTGSPAQPELSYESIDGKMRGVVGVSWVLKEKPVSVGWYSSKGVNSPSSSQRIRDALLRDVANLQPPTTDSSYFYGKAVARAARLALIAEEIGVDGGAVSQIKNYLTAALTPWMQGNYGGNGFLYDAGWGGLTTRNGAKDPAADFGFGVFNDHHFHLGYFCYAGAVLAKLDPTWRGNYKAQLYTMVADYMSSGKEVGGGVFPIRRHFDPWVLHSWASGAVEFADGRNQESSSEAVAAYYAGALVGAAYGDGDLRDRGLTLAALEARAARALWHVPEGSTLYGAEFVGANRAVGVAWANKRDAGLWFAAADRRDCRIGIQSLPILPVTELLYPDAGYAQELVEWGSEQTKLDSADGGDDAWKGFTDALVAISSPQQALQAVLTLKKFDDGNSLTNMLWWVSTRGN